MTLAAIGQFFILVSAACCGFVLWHAHKRSAGTLVMVLFIPCYVLYYGFSQFEHRRKGLVLAGWLGCLMVGVVLKALGVQLGRG